MSTMVLNRVAEPKQVPATIGRGLGLPGKIALTWASAGGILLGGYAVGALTIAGRLSGNALLLSTAALFVVGAALGLLHGTVLGLLGRPREMSRGDALRDIGMGVLYAIPALAVTFLLAGWIAMTRIAFYAGRPLAEVGSVSAWVLGLAPVIAAVWSGRAGLRAAFSHWPERRSGAALVGASVLSLGMLFSGGTLFGARVWLALPAAAVSALALSVWALGPSLTVALRLARKYGIGTRTGGAASLLLSVAAGGALAMLASAFQGITGSAAVTAGGTGLVLALPGAIVAETLLRVILFTVTAACVLRYGERFRTEAAVLGFIVTVAAELLLWVPALLEIGFGSLLSGVAFVLASLVLPAAVFSFLFWKRGIGPAVLAHAVMLAGLALLAR